MTWTDLRDQDGAVALLTRAIEAGRLAPAYLFVGPTSVGKALAARVFVQALNCEAGLGAACGSCAACRTIASGNHPDLLWARPEKRSRTISVETARATVHALALAPHSGRYRVAVFDDADCIHVAGQNALLKTLEEPARRACIVLVTATPSALLPTVRSRCQLVRFRPLETATVTDILKRDGVPATTARLAAGAADGSVAPARRLADTDRLAFLRDLLHRALAGEAIAASGDHAKDLDSQEKALEKSAQATALDPDLLSREQRQQLEQERMALVQREIAERIEADLRVLAIAVRDAVAAQAAGDTTLCMLGEPAPALAAAPPAALAAALDAIDRGLRYLRQYIRRDRVLFDVYGALQATGRAVA